MHESARTANLLGAAALAVADLALADATAAAGTSTSGAAALVVLAAAPGLGVTELGRRVGLSQSAAARMVDSLEAAELVRRQPVSGRSVRVELTPAGRTAADDLLAGRGAVLRDAVDALDPDEQRALGGLLAKVLVRLYGRIGSADLMCRLCDRPACVTGARCPVGQAERDRSG
jgi:MarR family transcriptional repressor of emrRAB